MEVDRDVTGDVNPSNQVSSFDPASYEWEVINPSSFHWPQLLPQAGVQSTISELSNLGDRGGSNVDQIFWVVDEDPEDAGMDDEEDQERLFNSMVLG